jgi:hypothetical protein
MVEAEEPHLVQVLMEALVPVQLVEHRVVVVLEERVHRVERQMPGETVLRVPCIYCI